ncbi:hypothetical protein QR680_008473 [Steinernema hermaphroditum]|uniref:RING-type domain-containing protein n=1 Tax=Steinernema hermaphroditum TaxID=289476 RepID=A0AA39M7X7_9BILA|nr:hypothetical protein QR680_008473 [Steinernema hermaphroditum]
MTETNGAGDGGFVEGECVLFEGVHEDHPTSRPGGFLSQFWNKYGVVARCDDDGGVGATGHTKCAFFLSVDDAIKRVIVKLNVHSLKRAEKVRFVGESKALLASKNGTVEVVRVSVRNNSNNEVWISKANGPPIPLEETLQGGEQIVPIYEAVTESRRGTDNQPNPIMQALLMQLSGKFVRMKPILKDYADKINELCDGRTPLLFAMEKEMWQAARILVAHGALPSVKNADGNNAYHLAVLMNQAALIVEFSRRNLCGVNAKNASGQRPFHLAIEKSHFACINALISCSLADVNVRDAAGDTVLHFLARKEETKHVLAAIGKILQDSSVDYTRRNQKGVSMFEEAILSGREKSVDLICKAAPGVILLQDSEGNFPIHLTTREGKCQILHRILNYNVDAALSLNSKGQTPLHMAVAQWEGDIQNHVDRLACIQNLVDMKVDLNLCDEDGETIGHYLAREALKTETPGDDILRLLRNKELFRSNVRLLDFAQTVWPYFHIAAFCYLVLMGLDLFAKDKKALAVIDYFNNLPKLSDLLEEYASRRIAQMQAVTQTGGQVRICPRSCGGNKSNVRFIPCGHIVMCSECAFDVKLRRCSKCYSKITKAVCMEGVGSDIPLNEPKRPEKENLPSKPMYSKARKEELAERIRHLKTLLTCKICEERRTNTVLLGCGHMACSECAAPELLSKCHICEADIEKRVHLYR